MFAIAILVGGEGSRVSAISNGKSKQEIEIFPNKKLIDYQINQLKSLNKKFFFISNTKYDSLKTYLNKKYKRKINFEIIEEKKPLGTAGALKFLEKFHYKFYLLVDGDLIFNINIKRLINYHIKKKSDCTLVVHPNNHPYDSDCLDVNLENRVIRLFSKPHNKKKIIKNLCMSGIKIINKEKIKIIKKNCFQDFSKFFLPKLIINKSRIFAYNTREYIKDSGTLDRIKQVRKDLKSIKYKLGNINNKIPAIFLDRDGVLNKQINKNIYQNPKKLFKNVENAVRKINQSGYLAILITNQPAVAKGFISVRKLENDLDYLNYQMGLKGAYLDRIYYCPHHPEKGFKGENINLKIKCNCRKPNNGMFLKAISDLNIDYKKSFMIGDNYTDYFAAKKSKINFILVNQKNNPLKLLSKKSVIEAVNYIFKKTNV